MAKIKLKEACVTITKGTTPTTVGGEFTTEGINFVKSESISTGKYLDRTLFSFIDQETDEKLKRSRLQAGDLLFSIAGAYLGKTAIVQDSDLPANTNQAVGIVRLNNKLVNAHYLYYYFSQRSIKAYINKLSSQSAQPNLNLELLGNLEYEDYPITTQEKIAKVLSTLDSKIELNNRINAELEAMAKTIYDYWFVQFDFPISKEQAKAMGKPKLEGKPYKASGGKMVWSEELKREVPENWEIRQLATILKCNYQSISKNDVRTSVNYLDTSSLTRNCIDGIQAIDCHKDVLPSRAQRIVAKNDILYSTVRPNQEHHGIIKEPIENMIASTGFAQLSSKDDLISNDLIYAFLRSESITERLQQIADSAVSAYPSISPTDILSQYIALPKDGSLLQSINDQFHSIHLMVSVNQRQSQKLSELRDWLLPMLMSGQVKIKEVDSKGMKQDLSVSRPASSYFYQTQLVAAIVNASKKHKITHGEMTLAKYTYLVDKLYGVPTYFNYERLHLGPYPKEMKKIVNNKKFFKIQNNEVSVVPQEKQYNYQFQTQVEEAVAELAAIFNQYKGQERSHQTELLATVCKVVEDIKSTELKLVRESMKNWPIDLKTSKFKNKAEKFSENETSIILTLLRKGRWAEALINS